MQISSTDNGSLLLSTGKLQIPAFNVLTHNTTACIQKCAQLLSLQNSEKSHLCTQHIQVAESNVTSTMDISQPRKSEVCRKPKVCLVSVSKTKQHHPEFSIPLCWFSIAFAKPIPNQLVTRTAVNNTGVQTYASEVEGQYIKFHYELKNYV